MVRSHIVIEMIRIPTVSIDMNGFIDSWKGIGSFDNGIFLSDATTPRISPGFGGAK